MNAFKPEKLKGSAITGGKPLTGGEDVIVSKIERIEFEVSPVTPEMVAAALADGAEGVES